MKLASGLVAALVCLGGFAPLQAQRETRTLATDWKFLKQDTTPAAKTDDWESVTVPHTWNVDDGADGKAAEPQYPEGYYRGPAWYARSLDVPAKWKGKRVFLRFQGVSLVADVFVNDTSIGQHRGGLAAFCFEITPYLRFDGKDRLRVRADNARTFDVAPLSGDFTVFGGIYRPVELIATDEVCVSPLEHGSPGFFVKTNALNKDEARIESTALVSNGTKSAAPVQIEVRIMDASGAAVTKASRAVEIPGGETSSVAEELVVPKPHLWNGRPDPYLYSAVVRVVRDGKIMDEVTQPLGIRTVAITQEDGFLLNGKPYPLHGVNRHQDRAGKGWAISDADHEEDHAMIVELGANTIRLAHYQQAEHFHDLSDRAGIIEWQEIPLVDFVSATPQFLENARQQLREMILQCGNHPSIAMWGLFNELGATWVSLKNPPDAAILTNLQRLAKELDPTRPTVAASWPQDPIERHRVPDWMAWNIYPGWYSGKPEDATKMIDGYSDKLGKRIGISEYGAGANPVQFAEGELTRPDPGGPFHPQEWQNHFHERLWAQLKGNPRLWGTWIWAMFDFASDGRNEGGNPGINDKGLVTRDRKIKKDTFYFYKANWNPAPMVYLASRRATPRKMAMTEVKAYSNCDEVQLKVNGETVGAAKPDDERVCRWEKVQLKTGVNRVEVSASSRSQTLTDSCEWTLEPPEPAKK